MVVRPCRFVAVRAPAVCLVVLGGVQNPSALGILQFRGNIGFHQKSICFSLVLVTVEKWSQNVTLQAQKPNQKNSSWLEICLVINIGADLPIYTTWKADLNNL